MPAVSIDRLRIMGDALISQIFEQFTEVTSQKIGNEYKLVFGVEEEIKNISGKLERVRGKIESAERRQVRDPTVKHWLESLKDVAYDVDDVICEWNTATRKMVIKRNQHQTAQSENKVCCSFLPFSSCFDFSRVVHRHDIAITIRDINKRLDDILSEENTSSLVRIDVGGQESTVTLRSSSSSSIEVPDVFGREEDKSALLSKLCSETSTQAVKETLQIISIVGLGGMGKTTLAKLIYNCDEVKAHFTEWIWVCISEPYNDVRVAKAIVESVEKRAPDVAELETALQHVNNCLNGKKFLLVLDDVVLRESDSRSWEQLEYNLKRGAPGSRVLVTTRNENVARIMKSSYIHQLGQLSDQDCWSLFSRIAFNDKTEAEKNELQAVGRQISRKCKGLPLSAYTIGGLMRSKSTLAGWRDVLKSEFWELNGAEDLSPPLMLSYYDLPSKLRQCFIYCAKFPKYYYIEADNLIKLWMAQGYLPAEYMEATGRDYLDELIMRCFFQNLEKDKESRIVTRFKMHDIVHDFAQYFTKNECVIVKPEGREQQAYSASANIRHLTLIRGDDTPFPKIIENSEKLHTYWVQSFYDSPPIVSQVDAVSSVLFHKMKYLKALDLSHNRLRTLPNEIEKVINLRYLNLSFNPLEKLPESVCDLYNLQTLKLVACNHLTELPQGIGKLENLRHLEIDKTDNLSVLPGGISQLRALRTLSKFAIRGGSGDANEAACRIKDLRNLNDLQGRLDLEGLGNVADASEANMAELKGKKGLLTLSMNFKPPAQTDQIMWDVAAALEPHTDLVHLEMKSYGGCQFPNWIVSLIHLKNLVILECQSCEQLPALGELPLLEKLHLESINNLKCIDHRFLNSNPRFGEEKVAFPGLKKLKIIKMRNLEEWNLSSAGGEVDVSNLRIMPVLRHFKLSECDKLETLPETLLQSTTIRRLSIKKCTILQQRYRRGGDERKKISHIRKIKLS